MEWCLVKHGAFTLLYVHMWPEDLKGSTYKNKCLSYVCIPWEFHTGICR